MLLPIDQHHRNLLGINSGQLLIVEDGQFQPPGSGVLGHPLDHHPRVIAQMAPRLTDQGDPGILASRPHVGRVDRLQDGCRFRRPHPMASDGAANPILVSAVLVCEVLSYAPDLHARLPPSERS